MIDFKALAEDDLDSAVTLALDTVGTYLQAELGYLAPPKDLEAALAFLESGPSDPVDRRLARSLQESILARDTVKAKTQLSQLIELFEE